MYSKVIKIMFVLLLGLLLSVQMTNLKKMTQTWRRSRPRKSREANHHSLDWARRPQSKSKPAKPVQSRPGRLHPGSRSPPTPSSPGVQQVLWPRQQCQRWRVMRMRTTGLRLANCRKLTPGSSRVSKTRMETWTRKTSVKVKPAYWLSR